MGIPPEVLYSGGEGEDRRQPTNKNASEQTYLSIIRAFLNLALRDTDDHDKRLCTIANQSKLIAHLSDRNPNLPGLSDGTLRKVFAEANKLSD